MSRWILVLSCAGMLGACAPYAEDDYRGYPHGRVYHRPAYYHGRYYLYENSPGVYGGYSDRLYPYYPERAYVRPYPYGPIRERYW